MGEKKRVITKWLYWFLFAVAIIVVYKTLDNFTAIGNWMKNLLDVLMPFIIGILIAYILYIPSKKIENIYAKVKKVKIDPEKVDLDDIHELERWIENCMRDGFAKAQEIATDKMKPLMGGLGNLGLGM